MPLMHRLKTLVVNNNRVSYLQPDLGANLPGLETLVLTNNNITELGDIDPLHKFPKLQYLSLMGNPVTHKAEYRSYVIFRLPQVRVLDFRRVKEGEREKAEKLFKGKKSKSLQQKLVKKSVPSASADQAPKPVLSNGLPAEDVMKIKPKDAPTAHCYDATKTGTYLMDAYSNPYAKPFFPPFPVIKTPKCKPYDFFDPSSWFDCPKQALDNFGKAVSDAFTDWGATVVDKIGAVFSKTDLIVATVAHYDGNVEKALARLSLLSDLGSNPERTMAIVRASLREGDIGAAKPAQLHQEGCIRQVLKAVWSDLGSRYSGCVWLVFQFLFSAAGDIGFLVFRNR